MEKEKVFNPQIKVNQNIISLEKGKIPPQAVDLEEAVLGAMMIDKKVYKSVNPNRLKSILATY